jgi:small subunit ribosomal protein S20
MYVSTSKNTEIQTLYFFCILWYTCIHMPITKSAEKALRSSMRKKAVNDRRAKTMKDAIKTVEKFVKKEVAMAREKLSEDKAAKTGIIKKNTAARRKSKLARMTKEN